MPKGPQGQKRPADVNKLAKRIVDLATGEEGDDRKEETPTGRRASRAGSAGGPARAAKLSPEKRAAIAKKAAESRWRKE
jgi:hypothetical protein